MLKKFLMLLTLAITGLALTASPIQADFIQCLGGVCVGTDEGDLINGTPESDEVEGAGGGDDVVLLGDGNDEGDGEDGNDTLFGGAGSDDIDGNDGNDVLVVGPDSPGSPQGADGGAGNDIYIVLAGETSDCLIISEDNEDTGFDVVNLLGFGPYSVDSPFGQSNFGNALLYVQDPIAGGDIYIWVSENGTESADRINGLPSPNVTIIPSDDPGHSDCDNRLEGLLEPDP